MAVTMGAHIWITELYLPLSWIALGSAGLSLAAVSRVKAPEISHSTVCGSMHSPLLYANPLDDSK